MKLLLELLNDAQQTNNRDDSFPGEENDTDNELDSDSGNEDDAELNSDDQSDIKSVVNKATENPDKQGAIRVVPGAHLVYKRQSKDGTYEELWIYKNEDMKSALILRRDIISGTDIPVNKSTSDDAKQSYVIWTTGNMELLHIVGLQN